MRGCCEKAEGSIYGINGIFDEEGRGVLDRINKIFRIGESNRIARTRAFPNRVWERGKNMKVTLPSNDGDSALSITLGSKSEYAHEVGFESNVELSSSHWDGDHTFPLCLKVDGFWLSRSDLMAVQTLLASWISQPLPKLATSVLVAEFELARLPSQSLMLIFGPRKDTIDERKPVFTVKLKAGAFQVESHFVTDQSCLALFSDELSRL